MLSILSSKPYVASNLESEGFPRATSKRGAKANGGPTKATRTNVGICLETGARGDSEIIRSGEREIQVVRHETNGRGGARGLPRPNPGESGPNIREGAWLTPDARWPARMPNAPQPRSSQPTFHTRAR